MFQLPTIEGIIRRRILVNYRVDADVMRRLLPRPFRPQFHSGSAIAGICLIRLEQIRPVGWPAFVGLSSENAAHRIAVEWDDPELGRQSGVYIPRRDTGSRLNVLTGGRIFPGRHSLARFDVRDDGRSVNFTARAQDGRMAIHFEGKVASALPDTSCFATVAESSEFFAGGSIGYSATGDCCRHDGLRLETRRWEVKPLQLQTVESSFFSDRNLFPEGSVQFDHALIMRDIPHRWHTLPDKKVSV